MRLVALTALAAAILLAAGPQSRPARASDLPGIWMMVDITSTAPLDPQDTLFAPYQIFAFDKKGGMKHMTSAKPFTGGQLSLFDAAPQITRYGVRSQRNPGAGEPLLGSSPQIPMPLRNQNQGWGRSEIAA